MRDKQRELSQPRPERRNEGRRRAASEQDRADRASCGRRVNSGRASTKNDRGMTTHADTRGYECWQVQIRVATVKMKVTKQKPERMPTDLSRRNNSRMVKEIWV
jgi:hypothetical protein